MKRFLSHSFKIHTKRFVADAWHKLTLVQRRLRANADIDKIKLVAIARDESAYLCEWIFHHLYFGFDEIDIFYNGCTDNTIELISLFESFPVNFINADKIFSTIKSSPQIQIYKSSFSNKSARNFDAIMFLDIDEFWVPVNLSDSIKNMCKRVGNFDTLSFQWQNKLEQHQPFTPALESNMKLEPSEQLKTIYRTYLRPQKLNPHNTFDEGLTQKFENGEILKPKNEEHSRLHIVETSKNAYILHRKDRSEKEYIALLARGRPIGIINNSGITFKNNRKGFSSIKPSNEIKLQGQAFQAYQSYMRKNLESDKLKLFISQARDYVRLRYADVLLAIEEASQDEAKLLEKILKGVTLPEVKRAYVKQKENSATRSS